MVISFSFVVDDMCLLQFVQHWLHLRDCSGSESVITSLRPDSLVVLWIFHPTWTGMWTSGTIFQSLRLDSSWWTSSSILQMAWTGIRTRGTNHLKNFESEDILWNPSQEMNSKWYLFGDKGEGVVNQGKGVVDLGSGIKQKIVKEKLGQYTKTENFTFAKIKRCKWKGGQVEQVNCQGWLRKWNG